MSMIELDLFMQLCSNCYRFQKWWFLSKSHQLASLMHQERWKTNLKSCLPSMHCVVTSQKPQLWRRPVEKRKTWEGQRVSQNWNAFPISLQIKIPKGYSINSLESKIISILLSWEIPSHCPTPKMAVCAYKKEQIANDLHSYSEVTVLLLNVPGWSSGL